MACLQRSTEFFKMLSLSFIILSGGCAEMGKKVIGISTADLEVLESGRASRTFQLSQDVAYSEVAKLFAGMMATIVVGDQKTGKIVAINFQNIFRNCSDTTEAGVFFQVDSSQLLKVTVVSPNRYLSDFLSKKVFAALDVSQEQ